MPLCILSGQGSNIVFIFNKHVVFFILQLSTSFYLIEKNTSIEINNSLFIQIEWHDD